MQSTCACEWLRVECDSTGTILVAELATFAGSSEHIGSGSAARFQEHDIALLVAAKLLLPLGKPARNAPKYFAAAEIAQRVSNSEWLSSATKHVAKHWLLKNQRKQFAVNCFVRD